ncbi:hypothetical protein D3C87_1452430 [compost metagenome]
MDFDPTRRARDFGQPRLNGHHRISAVQDEGESDGTQFLYGFFCDYNAAERRSDPDLPRSCECRTHRFHLVAYSAGRAARLQHDHSHELHSGLAGRDRGIGDGRRSWTNADLIPHPLADS